MTQEPTAMEVQPGNIWCYNQNKPTQVARDLEYLLAVPPDTTYRVLLARGVFKWLAVRRKLMKLKDRWKEEVTDSIARQRDGRWRSKRRTRDWERGYRAGIEACRAEVRGLCHGERWQAPDHDREAVRWLEESGDPLA